MRPPLFILAISSAIVAFLVTLVWSQTASDRAIRQWFLDGQVNAGLLNKDQMEIIMKQWDCLE